MATNVLDLDSSIATKECFLCEHENNYLLQMFDNLSEISDIENTFQTMYKMFKCRTKQPLDKPHPKISFEDFQSHFENHIVSLRGCIIRDISAIKALQDNMLQTIYKTENGASASINAYIRLSKHKVSLASKLKTVPKLQLEKIKPYEFT